MFANLKLAHRLALSFATLVALLLAMATAALWGTGSMQAASVDVSTNWLPSVERVNRMNTDVSDLRISEYKHVLNDDDKVMADIDSSMAETVAAFDDNRKAYLPLISGDAERKLYEAFDDEWKLYWVVHEQIIGLSRDHQDDKAQALLQGPSKALFDSAGGRLDKLIAFNHDGAVAAAAASGGAYDLARNNMVAGAVLSVALAMGLTLLVIRSIVGQVGGELADAAQIATTIAQGDLTHHITVQPGDSTSLMSRLAAMQHSLGQVVANVRVNAESLATASAQIAQGNLDLSGRTEQQASALQQTAATMEELGATVRNNADSARQANQLALGASAVAAKGGEVVGQVVTTMQAISESSRKIGDIIGVIDGIAFQTNILALNAAVEAARAGEQGRGFAVVASEVRSLAQRSAEAAKEIKSLIGRSVDQVEHGTGLVDQAGKTMGEIVGSIRRVTDVVAAITSASAEQSDGVQQVSQTVSQMDQATQQNAALVEQSAAAAESLKGQAQTLVQVVSVFRLRPLAAGTGHA